MRGHGFFFHEKLKFSIELLLLFEKISVKFFVKFKHHSVKPAQDFRSLYYHVWYFINCFDLTTKFGEEKFSWLPSKTVTDKNLCASENEIFFFSKKFRQMKASLNKSLINYRPQVLGRFEYFCTKVWGSDGEDTG